MEGSSLVPLMGTGHQRTQSSSIVILLSMYCIGTGQIDLPGQLADGRVRENLSPFLPRRLPRRDFTAWHILTV